MSYAVKKIDGGSDLIIPNVSGTKLVNAIRAALAAAGATSTIEVFDGLLGVVVAANVVTGSTDASANYVALDVLTIPSPAEGGIDIIIRVDTVDGGTGAITAFTVTQEGTGFVTDTDLAATGGSGTGATFDVTADDTDAVSIGKVSCTANLSDQLDICVQTKNGTSVRVTGASAKGYLYFE